MLWSNAFNGLKSWQLQAQKLHSIHASIPRQVGCRPQHTLHMSTGHAINGSFLTHVQGQQTACTASHMP
jgi:hypothetical protein